MGLSLPFCKTSLNLNTEFRGEWSIGEYQISDIFLEQLSVTFGIQIVLQGPGVGRKSVAPFKADKAPFFLKALLERK